MALFLPSSRRFIWVILCIAGAINSMWVLMMQSGSMLASWTASLTWRSRPLNLVLRTENLDPPSTPVARCWGGRPCCWCPGWPWSCVSWSWCGPLTSALVPCIIPHPPRWHSGWKQPYNKKNIVFYSQLGGVGVRVIVGGRVDYPELSAWDIQIPNSWACPCRVHYATASLVLYSNVLITTFPTSFYSFHIFELWILRSFLLLAPNICLEKWSFYAKCHRNSVTVSLSYQAKTIRETQPRCPDAGSTCERRDNVVFSRNRCTQSCVHFVYR